MHDAVKVLYELWNLTGKISQISDEPEAETLSLIFTRARTRGRKVMERFFRSHSSEVMETIVECWYNDTSVRMTFQRSSPHGHTQPIVQGSSDPGIAFQIVDVLTSSAQTVVHMLCESISYRVTASERIRKSVVNPNL